MPAYSKEFKEKYIKIYLQTFSVTKTVKACGIDRQTHYSWIKKDKWFAKEFKRAKKTEIDQLIEESENTHRIVRFGIPEKDDEGNLIGWKTPPDARANEWFLSKRSPDYNDMLKVEHSADENFADVIKKILSKDEVTPKTTEGYKHSDRLDTGE